MRHLFCIYTFFVLVLFSTTVKAQDADIPHTRTFPGIENPAFPYAKPEEVGISSEKLNQLGEEIVSWVANGDLVGGELLIIKDGKAVFHEAYGWSDREDKIPVERNSIWSIKSMSKPFTATAILMLAEEGKLSLDDPVSRYIPGFAGDPRTTIRHLLSHTSGYMGLGNTINNYKSLGDWVAGWGAQEPTQSFGEFSYSDFNYAALGYIIEIVSGMPADSFIERQIIEPLGLQETYTAFSPDSSWAARVSSRYEWSDEAGGLQRYWSNREQLPWAFYPAAWGLWATAMDYAEYLMMWLNKGHYDGVRLLKEKTVEEALAPHGLTEGNPVYGYGWFVETSRKPDALPPAFGHGGYDGTLARAFPDDNAMVILLTHSRKPWNRASFENRLAMLGLIDYPGPGMVWADEANIDAVELSPDKRDQYCESYRGKFPWMDEEIVVRVWKENERLHYRLGAIGEHTGIIQHLVPLGGDRFALGRYEDDRLMAIDPLVRIQFIIEEGKAKELKAGSGGEYQLTAQRADPEQLRIDIDRIRVKREAVRSKTPIHQIILATLKVEEIDAARALHRKLLASRPDSVRFGESLLNTLGYQLLNKKRTEEAIAVFEMNVEAYPEAPNPYDSLGDAYHEAGRLKEARQNYQRAVELAEQQGHENLETYREKLKQLTERMSNNE